MSWNAIIAGELEFPANGLEKWRAAQGVLIKHAWPPFLAPNIDATADDAVEDPADLTVAGRIKTEQTLCATFFVDFDSVREAVRLRALVSNDEFWGAVNDVVRMIGAAASLGGHGRVFFRYHGTGWGHDDGAIVQLAKGKLKTERIGSGEAPTKSDHAVIEEVAERAMGSSAPKSVTKKKKPLKRR